jgi:hypothetical protein
MTRSIIKPVFGVPSAEVTDRIGASDKVAMARAANFRFECRMRELEAQFETKAAELRDAFLNELAEIQAE